MVDLPKLRKTHIELWRVLVLISCLAVALSFIFHIASSRSKTQVEITLIILPFLCAVTTYELRIANGYISSVFLVLTGMLTGALSFSIPSLLLTVRGEMIENGFLYGNGWDYIVSAAIFGSLIGLLASAIPLIVFVIYLCIRFWHNQEWPHTKSRFD